MPAAAIDRELLFLQDQEEQLPHEETRLGWPLNEEFLSSLNETGIPDRLMVSKGEQLGCTRPDSNGFTVNCSWREVIQQCAAFASQLSPLQPGMACLVD